jgi:hypothetical protein
MQHAPAATRSPAKGRSPLRRPRDQRVISVPDGAVLLDFDLECLINDPTPQAQVLIESGYTEAN